MAASAAEAQRKVEELAELERTEAESKAAAEAKAEAKRLEEEAKPKTAKQLEKEKMLAMMGKAKVSSRW